MPYQAISFIIIFMIGIVVGTFLEKYLYYKLKDNKDISHSSLLFVEGINGLIYVMVYFLKGLHFSSLTFYLFSSALILIFIINWITYEIPLEVNLFILMLGTLNLSFDLSNILIYLTGFLGIRLLLTLVYLLTRGSAIGGGDIKLMAVSGLLLGFELIFKSFFIACILAVFIHFIRMKMSGKG